MPRESDTGYITVSYTHLDVYKRQDYYQPEAYLPNSDTYIEKDLAINDEIDKLRLAATSALLSGRKDVVCRLYTSRCV